MNIRTDLALEAKEMYHEQVGEVTEIDGVKAYERKHDGYIVTTVEVINESGADAIGKPCGKYITIENLSTVNDEDAWKKISVVLAKELDTLIGKNEDETVLVAGLGNWNITPDALGPKAVGDLIVTRNMIDAYTNVCSITPGVMGITGMETGEIISGIKNEVNPSRIIAIDALASRKLSRVGRTIQLADTGINPGAGVGNKRRALNEETLGVKVIAIGMPTVVDVATVACDVAGGVAQNLKSHTPKESPFYHMLSNLDENDRYNLIKESILPEEDFVVTPKDIDQIIKNGAKAIANGINLALHPDITIEDLW